MLVHFFSMVLPASSFFTSVFVMFVPKLFFQMVKPHFGSLFQLLQLYALVFSKIFPLLQHGQVPSSVPAYFPDAPFTADLPLPPFRYMRSDSTSLLLRSVIISDKASSISVAIAFALASPLFTSSSILSHFAEVSTLNKSISPNSLTTALANEVGA